MKKTSLNQREIDLLLFPEAISIITWGIVLAVAGIAYLLPLCFLSSQVQVIIGLPLGAVVYYYANLAGKKYCRQFSDWLHIFD
jgi:hypothetical protein